MDNKIKITISGGVGAGKSTIATWLSLIFEDYRLKYQVIEEDPTATVPPEALKEILERIGPKLDIVIETKATRGLPHHLKQWYFSKPDEK